MNKGFILTTILSVTTTIAMASDLGDQAIGLDSLTSITQTIRNMPNIEVGRGVTFQPKNKSYKMTMRFRMQNMAGVALDENFSTTQTQAQVKRLRLRFDGYIYDPRLTYSIQLGFTPYDAQVLPNSNMNMVRDAMVYYVPNSTWNIGFGQTKIRANRARVNSSSALQFVDRSIVNNEFNIDRDFGLFGEYHKAILGDFNIVGKGSITMGEGRNWSSSNESGLCYSGRVELFPLGRFKDLGDVLEGDFERHEELRFLIAGAYSFNDRTLRLAGTRGNQILNGHTRDLHTYFIDVIMKYRGWAFYADYMGRSCSSPFISSGQYIYTGNGINFQGSYILKNNWEFAIRNSTLIPKEEIKRRVGYDASNQTTVGVTKYLIGHSLKMQADASYNTRKNPILTNYNRWEFRVQVELGL